jgi:ribosome-associated protein
VSAQSQHPADAVQLSRENSSPRARPSKAAERADAARDFAIAAARMAAATRCHNIVLLDVAGLSPITDYFLIATGTSARQMRSACDDIEELGDARGFAVYNRSGQEGELWIAYDFVDVVLHVFNQDSRDFYDLDNLWGDAKKIEWREDAATPNSPTSTPPPNDTPPADTH